MTEGPLGQLAEIWRYPVSTLGGERLAVADLVSTGIAGDRLYGLYDEATDEPSAPHRQKRWRQAPEALAQLDGQDVAVSLDRRNWHKDEDAAAMLSEHLGFRVSLRSYAAQNARKLYKPAPIHLVTTASLRALAKIIPDSILDVRRFRPSLVVDIPGTDDFIEQTWLGHRIRVGQTMLHVTAPCVRCPFASLGQGPEVSFDKNVHGAITQKADSHFGIYCDVVTPGLLHAGDPVVLES
jgi:uncharacterized protein YcbX